MKTHALVKTAIFPVAGMGTRFLPATKSTPKEMLPLVDRPLIQYVVEEAIHAGITQLVFVTSSAKHAIEDYFDSNFELESRLSEAGKEEELNIIRSILPAGISCVYIRQHNPLGLGHAVLCAKNIVGKHPFAVLLADDIIDSNASSEYSCLKSMINLFHERDASIIAVEPVDPGDTEKYGIVSLKNNESDSGELMDIIEKPSPKDAPSALGVIGRYILTPNIFTALEKVQQGVGGEIQLTDGIRSLLKKEAVYAHKIKGIRYDCGNKSGFLEATLAYAMKDPELKAPIKKVFSNFSCEK